MTRSSSFGLVTPTSSLLIFYPLAARRVLVHGKVCIILARRRIVLKSKRKCTVYDGSSTLREGLILLV